MQKSNAPTKLTVAFASGTGAGPVNTVPLTPGATPGTASYQTGFTAVNMEPIASGGIPPFGADFNGILKAATTAQIWQQSGYMWPFDSAFASNSNINGYPQGALLARADGRGYWMNLADNNTSNPDSGGSNWAAVRANIGVTNIAMTDGTVVPTPDHLGFLVLGLVGTLTANAALQLPLTFGATWIIDNVTQGGFSVTVSGPSGLGVTVPNGTAIMVFNDGVNFFAVAAPTTGAYLPIDGTAVAATKLATPRSFSITGLAIAAGINFDGTDNVTFNVTALNVAGALGYTPANDAAVVHIEGTETITGAKTFSAGVNALSVTSSNNVVANTNFLSSNNFWVGATNGAGTILFRPNGVGSTVGQMEIDSSGAVDASGPFTCQALTGTTGTFSGAVTCTTMNATSSDRRLKRNIRKVAPRPLHRTVKFVSYEMKDSGWSGLGSIAQNVQRYAPEHVGDFAKGGKTYLSLNYAGMAYEQAMWAGQEIDRLTKRIAKLERALDRARIEPRKRGFVRRLLEAIW